MPTPIADHIRTLTLADATVSGLVSTRMYSDAIPQDATMPAIAYWAVDTIPTEHLGGIVAATQTRIQIDCVARTRPDARALADAVRLALEMQHRDVTGSGPFINVISLQQGEYDSIISPEAGTDQRYYVTSLDFFVTYQTTTS